MIIIIMIIIIITMFTIIIIISSSSSSDTTSIYYCYYYSPEACGNANLALQIDAYITARAHLSVHLSTGYGLRFSTEI